ncbi:MAG: hydantoinase/oxoprolinase family protein, partial [Solobacterium sp.]|nr:hydantoinase/oxoprolinase family protein [Solobacterium sp.]
ERSVSNPTEEDIISVRREAELKAIQNGASPDTVEVSVEVDTQRNIIRAIAVGATELRSKDRLKKQLTKEELLDAVANNLNVDKSTLEISAENVSMYAVQATITEKKLFGLVKKTTKPLRLIDDEGVIRLQKKNAWSRQSSAESWQADVDWMIEELTEYNDGGANLPNLYIVLG